VIFSATLQRFAIFARASKAGRKRSDLLFGRLSRQCGRRPRHISRLRLSARQPDGFGEATLQASLAAHYGGNYAIALALVAGIVAVVIVILTALGSAAKGVAFGTGRLPPAPAAVGPVL
jgi:hypothetical protein